MADPVKFPSGMPGLISRLHDMGFKAGVYSDGGKYTCGTLKANQYLPFGLAHPSEQACNLAVWVMKLSMRRLMHHGASTTSSTTIVSMITIRRRSRLNVLAGFNEGQSGTAKLSYDRYKVMSDALNATGRPIHLALCNWGKQTFLANKRIF